MNKHFLKGIALGTICTMAISVCIPVIAATGKKNIEVAYNNIKVYVYGEEKKPSQEPFVYNGSTYVPLRFISEALGETVDWDSKTNSVYIGESSGDAPVTFDGFKAISTNDAKAIVQKHFGNNASVTYRSDLNNTDYEPETYYCFEVVGKNDVNARSYFVYVSNGDGTIYSEDLTPIQ